MFEAVRAKRVVHIVNTFEGNVVLFVGRVGDYVTTQIYPKFCCGLNCSLHCARFHLGT